MAYEYKKHAQKGENITWQLSFFALLALQMSPCTSPMKHDAMLAEPYASILHDIMVAAGFIIPSLVLMWLYKRSERLSQAG
ncbi:hypothetical protein [Acinetobacter sp. YH12023]|uniref:hypothetical protein n=1 Tax=Acinetobacter sp. YH12023 TaxID=2601041 RepID=UPI0015D1EA3E|nr:hypothetical protein [Acinetobacter sp. YH12023]